MEAPRRASALRRPREEGVWNSESDDELRSSSEAPLVRRPQLMPGRGAAKAKASGTKVASKTSKAKAKASKSATAKKTEKNFESKAFSKAKVVNDWGPWLPSNRNACWKELSKALLPGRPKRQLEAPKAKAKPKAKASTASKASKAKAKAKTEEAPS